MFTLPAQAKSGCCSSHEGVCGCRCCDGSSLSAVCADSYPNCREMILSNENSLNLRLHKEIDSFLEAAQDYFLQAEKLNQSNMLPTVLYDKIIFLYDHAEVQLQYALEKTFESQDIKKIENSIEFVRFAKDRLRDEKFRSTQDVENLLWNKKLQDGMTSAEIIKILGRPSNIQQEWTNPNFDEIWIYAKPPVLYFKKGYLRM